MIHHLRRPLHSRACACLAIFGLAFTLAATLAGQEQQTSPPASTDRPADTQKPSSPTAPLTAPELFQNNGCSHCHMLHGEGGHKGPDLSSVGLRLKDDAIRRQIIEGKGAMPAFGDVLSADETTTLVAFLHRAREKPAR